MKFLLQPNKRYSKRLDNIFKSKNFSVEVSNLLLLLFNQLNDVYKDYEKVKVNVLDKDVFLTNFLENLENNIEEIEIIKENIFEIKKEDLGKTGIKPIIKQERDIEKRFIDERNKKIRTQLSPIELYSSLVEIEPKYFHIKDEYLFKDVLQNILEDGSNYDQIEIVRDFRGFSWFPKHSERFPYVKNLIYQNLVYLLGAEFMNNWKSRNVNLPDYIKEIKLSLIKQYGKTNTEDILNSLYASLYAYEKNENKEVIEKEIIKKKRILKSMNDSAKFLTSIHKQKKQVLDRIDNIDLILADDEKLVEAFKEKNNTLEKNKKIASVLIYKSILKEEREKASNKYDFLTLIQNPSNFSEYRTDLKRQISTFNKERKINDCIVSLELAILKAMRYKMEKEENAIQILSNLNALRYFKFLKVSRNLYIKDIKQIYREIEKLEKILVTKACKIGCVRMLSYDVDINYNIISTVLNTRILDLEDLSIEIDYKPMNIGVRIYDKNTIEKEEIIKVNRSPDLAVKLRRKIKLFV